MSVSPPDEEDQYQTMTKRVWGWAYGPFKVFSWAGFSHPDTQGTSNFCVSPSSLEDSTSGKAKAKWVYSQVCKRTRLLKGL